MTFSDINPYIRFFWTRKVGEDYSEPLMAYDFRLFYGVFGEFMIDTEKKTFCVKPNMFVIIPPATPYRLRLHPDFGDDHLFHIFNFDMTCRRKDHKLTIYPQPERMFNPELIISSDTPDETAQSGCYEGDLQTFDMIKEIGRLFSIRPAFYREECSALLKQIITHGIRKQYENDIRHPKEISAILAFIREHYQSSITNASIAKQFQYHPNHLNRVFKKHMGISLHSYVIDYRLKMARELLVGTNYKIEEIARASGFDSPSYFAKYFKKKYGMPPLEYRMGS
jgi:AraC-like DNA-binding protein